MMETDDTQISRVVKRRKGRKEKKFSFVPLPVNLQPVVKIVSRGSESTFTNSDHRFSDFPALPSYTEHFTESSGQNFSPSNSFSNVLSRKLDVQYSDSKVSVDEKSKKYNGNNKNNSLPKPISENRFAVQSEQKKSAKDLKEVNNVPDVKKGLPDIKKQNHSVEQGCDLGTNSSQQPSAASSSSDVKKGKRKHKRKSKKVSPAPQGKVNTISLEQYQAYTATSVTEQENACFQTSFEDESEYPALGQHSVNKNNTQAKQETIRSKKDGSDNTRCSASKNEVYVSPSKEQLPVEEGSPDMKGLKPTPKKKSPPDKKFNAPFEMSLLDIISQGKKKNSKTPSKFQPLCVKREKIKPPSKCSLLNPLDSSAPARKRGKEREVPRKPKLSKMKKVILKERSAKMLRRSMFSNNRVEVETTECIENIKTDTQEVESEMQQLSLHSEQSSSVVPLQVLAPENQVQIKTEPDEEMEKKLRLKCAKKLLHCRKFREYCNHFISEEVDTLTNNLLAELVRYQDRLFLKDPVKARARRRLICGLKEVTKNLKLRKLKLVIVAPDIEEINAEGGLNDALNCIFDFCENYSTPLMFSLPRRKLGRVCRKKVPLSCVGIFNYEGAEEIYKQLLELVDEARQVYKETLSYAEQNLTSEVIQILNDDQANGVQVEHLRTSFWQSLSKF